MAFIYLGGSKRNRWFVWPLREPLMSESFSSLVAVEQGVDFGVIHGLGWFVNQ